MGEKTGFHFHLRTRMADLDRTLKRLGRERLIKSYVVLLCMDQNEKVKYSEKWKFTGKKTPEVMHKIIQFFIK